MLLFLTYFFYVSGGFTNGEWQITCIPIDVIFKIKCLQVRSILEKLSQVCD
jgi:hypothetical protein